MSAVYRPENREDEMYERERQRKLDEEIEAAALQDAFMDGQRAGQLGLSAGLNPWQRGTGQSSEWERGRSAVIGARLNGRAA